MKIQLSDHFNYKTLFRFTLPSIVMMIFTSIYVVVDGLFVSNFVGKTQFAALNFIYPVIMILGAIGFMFGAGGSALVAKTMGEGNKEKAQKLFSLFIYATIVCGAVLALLAYLFMPQLARLLGAEGQMLQDCITYGRVLALALPFYMLQFEFQSFFVAAEKPSLGLIVTVAAGLTNIVMDALLTAVFPLGLVGAATATALSQMVGGVLPIIYFLCRNSSLLRLTKTTMDWRAIGRACANGSSELMSNIAMSVVAVLYNAQLYALAGENGIAAYGVLMYVNMVFLAIFIGYAVGIAPVVGYHYGAENFAELKSLLKKSVVIIGVSAVAMFGLSEALGGVFARIFVGYDPELMEITKVAFVIFSFSFLFAGFAIFGSSFFTALNNGLVSAIISFLRTLVFQVGAVLLFPLLWGLEGIWWSVVAAEVMAVVVTTVFIFVLRKKYQYM
ncbi:MAG: MATE family efflux transporter [Clostridiales bacterium]|nr:MATE family efflux transporter [Clostridiales bacterium]